MTGDDGARLHEFVAGQYARLRRSAFLMCGDWALADELTQKTLARLVAEARRTTVEDPDAFVYSHLMAAFQRRRSRTRQQLFTAAPPPATRAHRGPVAQPRHRFRGVSAAETPQTHKIADVRAAAEGPPRPAAGFVDLGSARVAPPTTEGNPAIDLSPEPEAGPPAELGSSPEAGPEDEGLKAEAEPEAPVKVEAGVGLGGGSGDGVLGGSAGDPVRTILVLDALHKLAPRCRAVLVLRHWDGFAVDETADMLGLADERVEAYEAAGLAALDYLLAMPEPAR